MLKKIPVKLPKPFEEALGYPGNSKWVAFYWEPCGDEAMYDDGICSGDGNWWGFLQFVRHPSVAPWLADCNLGSSDGEASHWLLCDRGNRKVYVGERGEISAFLNREALKLLGSPAELEVSLEELKEMRAKVLTKLIETMQQVPAPSMAEVEEKMRRDEEAVEVMVAELAGVSHE